jgi:hypothetical protein
MVRTESSLTRIVAPLSSKACSTSTGKPFIRASIQKEATWGVQDVELIGGEAHPRTVRSAADTTGEGCPEIDHSRPADHLGPAEVALHRNGQRLEIGLRDEPRADPRPFVLQVMFVLGVQAQRPTGGEPVHHRHQQQQVRDRADHGVGPGRHDDDLRGQHRERTEHPPPPWQEEHCGRRSEAEQRRRQPRHPDGFGNAVSEERQVRVTEGLGEPEQVDQAMQNKQCCYDDPDHGVLPLKLNVTGVGSAGAPSLTLRLGMTVLSRETREW